MYKDSINPINQVKSSQEDLVNHLIENSARITNLVSRLRSSSLGHQSTIVDTLEIMTTSANEVTKEVTKWGSWRDRCHTYYVDGLSYDQVKDKNIKIVTYVLFSPILRLAST